MISIKKPLLTSLFATLALTLIAQSFDVVSIIKNGPDSARINIVMMGDGYKAAQQDKFVQDATAISNALFNAPPFREYRNFFNVYAIKVPSNESGADHPGTATDVTEPAFPVLNVDNVFNSSFDAFKIHRLLVAQNSQKVYSVLAANFPDWDQAFVVVNSPYYGGSGGAIPTTSTEANSAEIAIHELGHSFSALADEYWAGDVYAGERANMTAQSNPTLVKWKNWVGTSNVGVYPYGSAGNPSLWFKPVNGQCKMEYLGQPFCPVCREAIINRIYAVVKPISAYTPAVATVASNGKPLDFAITPVYPNPNTAKLEWKLNGQTLTASGPSVTIQPAQLTQASNQLSAILTDNTAMSRSYLPAAGYVFTRTWTISQSATPVEDPGVQRFAFRLFPNPASDQLLGRFEASEAMPDLEITVTTLEGKIIHREVFEARAGENTWQTDISRFPAGMYLLRLRAGAWEQAYRWVKQ